MEIFENYDLTKLNTFGIKAHARFFAEIKSEGEIEELFANHIFKENKKLFLGGGSNILFTKDFDGIVVLNKLKGIEVLKENDESVLVKSMSGEVWHDLVKFAVEKGYWGIENLSFIPGTVGAAPMQNIGAYGAELKEVLENIEALSAETGEKRIFTREECDLGYRDSVFKNELRGKYFITAVVLKLSKIPKPKITYRHLKEYLDENKVEVKSSKDISAAVTSIRKSKLPDPAVIANAGSFFKNVFVGDEEMRKILALYPDLPYFEEGGVKKIPAGWLIEKCEWKGKRMGNVGVHDRHALVLVNHGGASGAEILELANKIIASVKEKFGLELTPEVNIV